MFKSKLSKGIAVIGTLAVGGFVLANYLQSKKEGNKVSLKNQSVKELDKQEVLKILKDLHKQFFITCTNMALYVKQMAHAYSGQIQMSELREFVSQNPQFQEELKSVERKVYSKYQVTEQDLKHTIDTKFKDDKEVLEQKQLIKKQYDDSLVGIPPDPKTEIPEHLTKSKTLEILKKIFSSQQSKLSEAFKKLQEEGLEINLQDPKVNQVLQNLKLEDVKERIIEDYNLNTFEDPGQKILQYATQKFSQEDREFAKQLMELELQHSKSMESIIQQSSGGMAERQPF